ncbi:MAG: ABC transporter permease [Bryobacteraceae bacterium]
MSGLFADLRYSIRRLRKSPGMAAIAILTLGLGMAGTTSVYTIMDAWIFQPLPFADATRLIDVRGMKESDGNLQSISAAEFDEWKREARSIEDLAGYRVEDFRLTGDGRPQMLKGGRVTTNFFHLLETRFSMGRGFREEESVPGQSSVTILSQGLWRDRFNADPAIIGKTIQVDEQPHTVIGVLPADFHFPLMGRLNLITPFAFTAEQRAKRRNRELNGIGRLRPGSTASQAEAETRSIAKRMAQLHPSEDSGRVPRIVPLADEIRRHHDAGVMPVMFAMTGCLLLIACSNVANIMLARAAARRRETAVRLALGGARWQVTRQWIAENCILFLAAGAAGAVLTPLVLEWITASIPFENRGYLRNFGVLEVNAGVLAFAFAVSAIGGVLFGLLPAAAAVRGAAFEGLRDGTAKATASKGSGRLRSVLVAAQFALALALMVGAGLLWSNARELMQRSPGFDSHGLMTFALAPSEKTYTDQPALRGLFDRAIAELRKQPEVEHAALATWVPFTESGGFTEFRLEGRPDPAPGELQEAQLSRVSGGYGAVLRLVPQRGRMIGEQDGTDAPQVAVINQAMERRYFAGRDPVGTSIRLGPGNWRTIVGVVGDVKTYDLTAASGPQIYVPLSQSQSRYVVGVVRGRGELDPVVRRAMALADPGEPLIRVVSIDTLIDRQITPFRVMGNFIGTLGVAALFLAAIGLYGSISYAVAQRTKEIGIRMALGARGEDIAGKEARGLARVLVGGMIPGLALAVAIGKALSAVLVGVSPFEWKLYAGMAVLLVAVAALAAAGPVRRAMRTSPVIALRHE